ncbi:nuclear transcription factor Y subunit B-1 isoform X2 [Papilio machaon]|uniref:nuclear transcription factor Y subunit B-1 isoform X2 n=1 Tax=Papilio machaon TaxID=76193 RepID=UPI001E662B58|nr:nuclear transcription factor Y subunit B-1 isoform X2 [Papilio machaon]
MESDELGNEIVRLDNGFMVDEEETFVVNSDDVLEQEENNSDSNCGGKNVPLREQDRFLPIANIAKIMKRAIPENGKIAKDARECVQECISEFISFITSEASDRCQMEKRKTINGEDVLFAMNQLGFDNYVDPLKIYLKKYREIVLSPKHLQVFLKMNMKMKQRPKQFCIPIRRVLEILISISGY